MEEPLTNTIQQTHLGLYDHWHIHMQGLKRIFELYGPVQSDWGYVFNKVRRYVTVTVTITAHFVATRDDRNH